MTQPPVCDYEGSDYQSSFWERGGREYEDRVEAIALRRLLPARGRLMLELGAGAGRNTARYAGFERVVLVDYSRTQLQQAQQRLGSSSRYVYVAADIYRLPFVDGLFDAATMIRTLHHMAEPVQALSQARAALAPGATFILEYANKLNLKAIVRYALRRQDWSPFSPEPVEFATLNFDFHPSAIRRWLSDLGLRIEQVLTVSHFRSPFFKRIMPLSVLVGVDSLFQWTGALWQLTPSVFVKSVADARTPGARIPAQAAADVVNYFKCPACGHAPLLEASDALQCPNCSARWPVEGGLYDFRNQPDKKSGPTA